ncbi:hypothetical protein RUM43_004106 [Polyplax serrata]|uniref:Colmedin n=1 Tax=Polyplax serrata TaxID=468196 RepID=A0AAN8SB51_POLSC
MFNYSYQCDKLFDLHYLGLPGPRGRTGKAGNHGTPGIPGVNLWTVKVNGTTLEELLMAPSIIGAGNFVPPKPIVVREGENVRMRCAAEGRPKPSVEWRKFDGSTIPVGSWQAISVPGHALNITRINRQHMGVYMCIADNGIPPPANQTFVLEVHFAPLIRIQNQLIGVANGSTAILECDVEAFPESVRYWERADGRFIEPGFKYRLNDTERGKYKVRMQLNITNIGVNDFGLYHCISKNEIGITKGIFTVYEIDPGLATPPPVRIAGQGVATYGEQPPPPVDFDDICPPQVTCPECPDPKEFKCREGSISLFDLVGKLEIKPFGNETYPGLPNRTLDCLLYAVGKPVYHRYTDQTYGSWMRDPMPRTEAQGETFWVTSESDSTHLYEFANKTAYRKDIPTRVYELEHPLKGNAHVIYNGSFYYNEKDKPRVLKFDLATKTYVSLDVPMVATSGSNYLYTTEFNYMDFSIDDNGLWIIYGLPSNNNTIVMKIDPNTMKKQYMWDISINHHKVGEMFVTCGVLYAIDSVTERNTKIRFALDLYKNILLDVSLAFTNPFRRTTMVGYNHRTKELYTWDKGNQLTYPVRYHEIGYNLTKEEKGEPEANARTGYDIYT